MNASFCLFTCDGVARLLPSFSLFSSSRWHIPNDEPGEQVCESGEEIFWYSSRIEQDVSFGVRLFATIIVFAQAPRLAKRRLQSPPRRQASPVPSVIDQRYQHATERYGAHSLVSSSISVGVR